ncbi:hypothetical protein [Halobellus rubicundus]|uniref:Uncharacterized protein n=1 Tax=Halobellus rubicundus TaxID=2996466 RepID=A0ABD5MEK0_9EURY
MTPLEWVLVGVVLTAVPSTDLAAIAVAWLAKKAGLKPSDIRKYNAATSDGDDSDTHDSDG